VELQSEALELSPVQWKLIERISAFHEKKGHIQPAASRILALLMVSDSGNLTFDEILHTLKLSKGAVSQALQMLVSMQHVETFAVPGERKRQYRLRTEDWHKQIEESVQGLLNYSEVLKDVLVCRGDKNPDLNQHIRDVISFLEVLHRMLRLAVKNVQNPSAS
jgi:DNA-binding transcriptional regulator GbsR (MarR family)